MLRFLAVALFALHLCCGEIISLEQEGRRFSFGDGEYEISAMRTDWFAARNFCKVQGGKLMSIETQAENTAIMEAIENLVFESVWTSGWYNSREGVFYWDSTGAPVENFTFWGPSQPRGYTDNHCIELNATLNHTWANVYCYSDRLFVCEFHPCSDTLELKNDEVQKSDLPLLTFTFEGRIFEVYNKNASWVEAKNFCKLRGMELVSIETYYEHQAIMDALSPLPPMSLWTSGTNDGDLGNFYWESTGHAVGPFTGWAPGEPSHPNNINCILLYFGYSHYWSDYDCFYPYNYICELKPCQP